MKRIFIILSTAILIMLSLVSCGKDDVEPDINASTIKLTIVLDEIYDHSNAPGFAVSVVKGDKVAYQKAFGKADIDNEKEYTNQTTQPIASISKTFAAAAMVKAIEQGYFNLETDINDILPMEVINPKDPDDVIKVKHLVTHTSGLIDNFGMYVQTFHILPGEDLSTPGALLLQDGFGVAQREATPIGDFLASYYLEGGDLYSEDNFAATPPGTYWEYSNIATSLAAYMIEVATGQSYHDYVQSNIIQPLGMFNTSYDLADMNPDNMAKLYWDLETALPNYSSDSYPDGGIRTSNEDLAKFLLDMMKGAKGQSQTLFFRASYTLLFEALLPNGLMPAEAGESQGVFWVLEDGKISHDGGDPGTTTDLQFNEAGDEGYLLITNMDAIDEVHANEYIIMREEIKVAINEFIAAN